MISHEGTILHTFKPEDNSCENKCVALGRFGSLFLCLWDTSRVNFLMKILEGCLHSQERFSRQLIRRRGHALCLVRPVFPHVSRTVVMGEQVFLRSYHGQQRCWVDGPLDEP